MPGLIVDICYASWGDRMRKALAERGLKLGGTLDIDKMSGLGTREVPKHAAKEDCVCFDEDVGGGGDVLMYVEFSRG